MLFVKSAPPSGGRGGAVNNGGDQPPPFNALFTSLNVHLAHDILTTIRWANSFHHA